MFPGVIHHLQVSAVGISKIASLSHLFILRCLHHCHRIFSHLMLEVGEIFAGDVMQGMLGVTIFLMSALPLGWIM